MTKGNALEFLFKLAEKHHTVCLPGKGFAGPDWSLRVALANIDEQDCKNIGKSILSVMTEYKKALKA